MQVSSVVSFLNNAVGPDRSPVAALFAAF